jgi:hypothetical protein
MEKIIEPVITNYKFIKDLNSDIVSAVYPMREHLKKENNNKMSILGGSPVIQIQTGMTRFDELGIPVGLYLESRQISFQDRAIIKETNSRIIDDTLFEKLLGSVSSVKPYSGTRKNYQYKKSQTKKK